MKGHLNPLRFVLYGFAILMGFQMGGFIGGLQVGVVSSLTMVRIFILITERQEHADRERKGE